MEEWAIKTGALWENGWVMTLPHKRYVQIFVFEEFMLSSRQSVDNENKIVARLYASLKHA